MPFAPPLVDTFNRADNANLGTASVEGAWSGSLPDAVDGGQIISNQAAQDAASGHSAHTLTYGPDVQVGAEIATKPANGQFIGIFSRGTDINTATFDGYLVLIDVLAGTDQWNAYRMVNGAYQQITTPATTLNQEIVNGNKMGFEVTGTGATVTVTAYIDTGSGWTSIGSWTDTDAARALSAGRTGIYWDSAAVRIENYYAGTTVVASPVATVAWLTA